MKQLKRFIQWVNHTKLTPAKQHVYCRFPHEPVMCVSTNPCQQMLPLPAVQFESCLRLPNTIFFRGKKPKRADAKRICCLPLQSVFKGSDTQIFLQSGTVTKRLLPSSLNFISHIFHSSVLVFHPQLMIWGEVVVHLTSFSLWSSCEFWQHMRICLGFRLSWKSPFFCEEEQSLPSLCIFIMTFRDL